MTAALAGSGCHLFSSASIDCTRDELTSGAAACVTDTGPVDGDADTDTDTDSDTDSDTDADTDSDTDLTPTAGAVFYGSTRTSNSVMRIYGPDGTLAVELEDSFAYSGT